MKGNVFSFAEVEDVEQNWYYKCGPLFFFSTFRSFVLIDCMLYFLFQ